MLDSNLYLHDSDRAAMAALKAIPGFAQVVKAFMKVWNEKQFKIINMSTNLKLGENQMAKYYNMLIPICEKLGIEVPELYVELDVNPNAYTFGDTKPFIVITSGLFETLPDELIPTVLAHECGHIVCRHTLYHTMGSILLNGAGSFVTGLGNIALYPIQLAFAYWMRCSEYSADRVAAICDGTSDKIAEVCMRFAGYDKDIMADASIDLFLEQAKEYREMVKDSAWDKTLEFIMFKGNSHPLNAVRAYECKEWEKSERYQDIFRYLNRNNDEENFLPVEIAMDSFKGKKVGDAHAKLISLGFDSISLIRHTDLSKIKNEVIAYVVVNGIENPKKDWYKLDSSIELHYFLEKTEDELAAEHPDEIKIGNNHKYFLGKNAKEVIEELYNLGFENIVTKEMAMPKFGIGMKAENVAKIMIDQADHFDKNSWFKKDIMITIYVYIAI